MHVSTPTPAHAKEAGTGESTLRGAGGASCGAAKAARLTCGPHREAGDEEHAPVARPVVEGVGQRRLELGGRVAVGRARIKAALDVPCIGMK